MRGVFATAVALTVVLGAVLAVSPRARADEPMTKTQGDAILDELRQIKKLLERMPPAPSAAAAPRADERVKVGLGTAPSIGRSDAPVVMVEFTDYQCPFCQRSEEHTSELQSQSNLVCRLLLEKKKKKNLTHKHSTLSTTHTMVPHVCA